MICNGLRDNGSCVGCACGDPHEEVAACGTAMACAGSLTGVVRCVWVPANKKVQDE